MKRLALLLSGLLLCVGLAGCGGDTGDAKSGLTHEQLGLVGVDSVSLTDGVTINIDADAMRGFYYDLAQDMRWDFLPPFAGGEAPQQVEDYIYLVLADELVWSDGYNIDNEKTPDSLTAEYVSDYILTHFGVQTDQPEAGSVARVDFDGEKYAYPAGSWSLPPHYELNYLTVSGSEGEPVVYTACMTKYVETGSVLRDDWRDVIVNGTMDEAPLSVEAYLEVKFTLDEDSGEIRYLAVGSGADDGVDQGE